MDGIKGQDVVVLLKLASLREHEEEIGSEAFQRQFPEETPYSVRSLEGQLGISKTEVNASIRRSLSSGLAVKDSADGRPRPNRRNLLSFIVHGLKFVFPTKPGPMTRGTATAFAAPMLQGQLLSGDQYIFVWPFAEGRDMGQSIQPLFKSVPAAVLKDDGLYEYLALVDAIRLGNQREAGLAENKLSKRLLKK